MSATVFVDTNVLVYARDAGEPIKQPRAADWIATLWRARTGRVSWQVLDELYVTLTRKLKPAVDAGLARTEIRNLLAWQPVAVDYELLERAWVVEDRFGFHFWDALIVAAAQGLACDVLLTEDLQDGQVLDGMRVVDPFAHTPDSV